MAEKPIKLTQDLVDEEALKFVLNAKKHFNDQRKTEGYENEWQSSERSYFNHTADFYKGVAKVRVPVLHQSVERIVPKLEKSTFPRDGKWFDAVPDNTKDEIQREDAELAIQLLRDQTRDINARNKIIKLYRSLSIYGTAFIKTIWTNKVKERFKRDAKNKRVKVWETTLDTPDFYSPSIWDIYADIKDEDLEGLVIERIVKDFQELWEKRIRTEKGKQLGIFRNVDKLKTLANSKPDKDDANKTESEKTRSIHTPSFGEHENKVEVFEAWGPIPKWFLTKSIADKENKLFIDGLIVIAQKSEGTGAVLMIDDNPFDHQDSPYLRGRYLAIEGRLYGLGVMTVNVPLEAELNTLRNQGIDNRTFMLKNKWLKDVTAEIDDNSLKDLTEQVIETNNVLGLQPLRPPNFTGSIIAADQMIKQDIEDSTGASKLIGGTPSGSSLDRTASGIATVVQGGLDRLELVAINIEDELLNLLLKRFWQLNQQFLPKGREVSVLGKELVRVLPQSIALPSINFIGLKELGEKDFKISTLNTLIQNLAPFAQAGIDTIPILFMQLRLMGFGDLIFEIDKRPTQEQLLEESPEGEIQLLRLGRRVRINFDDRHEDFIRAYRTLLSEENLPGLIRKNTEDALGQRLAALTLRDNPEILENIVKSRKTIGTVNNQQT